jgi:diadenosine tetraphosphate (Ap4A) HIT family hydrolase
VSHAFELDGRLAADTLHVGDLPLSRVLLMRDRRYPWLVLVPRRAGMVEVSDLAEDERATLWREVDLAGTALRSVARCDKLNIGALGNIVRQLHVHVIARVEGDAAWPGPVWGHGMATPYDDIALQSIMQRLRQALA